MSRIFISHSSYNDDWAIALKDWLVREGWSGENDIFLDLDPERGISAGQKWVSALEEAATRCEAVLFLVSEEWLTSKWCHDEYQLASKRDKKIFALLIDDIGLELLPRGLSAEWQVVCLKGEPAERFLTIHPYTKRQSPVYLAEAGLRSLKSGLEKAGIGADTFDLQPDAGDPTGWRMPYRGLEALEPEDAGVFFGRSADIMRGMDALRGLAARPSHRLLVILGASGAGKSSYLRAGLWPRLLRDDAQWLPLRAIRAGRGGAIEGAEGLLASLEELHRRFAVRVSRAELRRRMTPEAFVELLRELQNAAARRALLTQPPYPLPVLCLDQAEEIFAADVNSESQLLLNLARAAIDADAALLLASMRSDSYGLMQTSNKLADIYQMPFSLGPVSQGEIGNLIREPAEILRRKTGHSTPVFDAAVIAHLQSEIAGESDALPLLAFVLQRLMREHAASSKIGVAELDATGGVAEAIESAAEAALEDAGFEADRGEKRNVLRRLFIPRLARVDRESKAFQRRSGRQSELPTDLVALARALIERRLLVVKAAAQTDDAAEISPTLEVAHEALLRRWPTLADLLAEDRDALLLLDGVLSASADWTRVDVAAKSDFVNHRGSRLAEVQALEERGGDWASELAPAQAYITACQAREAAELAEKEAGLAREQARLAEVAAAQWRQAVLQRRARWALGAVGGVVLAAAGLFSWQTANSQRAIAEGETRLTRGQKDLAESKEQIAAGAQALQHERVNVLTYVAKVSFNANAFDSALRYAVEANKLDPSSDKSQPTPAAVELEALMASTVERIVFTGHEDVVRSAMFSADGSRIVTSSDDSTARVWDVATGQMVAILRGHENNLYAAVFNPDGKRIVTASWDKTARLWDAAAGRLLVTLKGHSDKVVSANFSPDGKQIVTASWDNTARLWDAMTGQGEAILSGHDLHALTSAVFSPDGRRVVTVSNDTARVWEASTGQIVTTLRHDRGISNAVFSPDGEKIVTASDDDTARVWDISTGQVLVRLQGHKAAVRTAAFSPDGRHILTASLDRTARLWDANSGAELAVLRGHEGEVYSAVFSPDGRRIVTTANDHAARLWDTTTGHELAVLRGHTSTVESAAFSADGTHIVTASYDRTARMWDTANGQALVKIGNTSAAALSPDGHTTVTAWLETAQIWDNLTGQLLTVIRGHEKPVTSVAFSSNGQRIVTTSEDTTARLWNVARGQLLAVLRGHSDAVIFATFSPDGSQVVTVSDDQTARLWNAESGEMVSILDNQRTWVRSAVFSPDGKIVLTISHDNLALWESKSGRLLAVIRDYNSGVNSAAFSPDGKQIVTTSSRGTARILDAATGQDIRTLIGHINSIWKAVFSPDGKRIVCPADFSARVWDSSTGQVMMDLPNAKDAFVYSANFSPDGNLIVTSSEDYLAHLWDSNTGEVVAVLSGHQGKVAVASFSQDGQRVMTGASDLTTRLWDVRFARKSTDDHLKEACSRLLRGLSKMPRDDMRLAGYSDKEPEIDVCKGVK